MPTKTNDDAAQAIAIQQAIAAIVEGLGRGGLTRIARTLGMTPSALLKRLQKVDGGFDLPTFRAVAMLTESKAKEDDRRPVTKTAASGSYIIETRKGGGFTWRKSPGNGKLIERGGPSAPAGTGEVNPP